MEKNYNIRNITIEDYPTIIKWWEAYSDTIDVPKSNLLPNNGLGGYVVEIKDKIVAAGFLYLTNSALAYADYLIADPNFREKDRNLLILKLGEHMTKAALKLGYEKVWLMTTATSLIEKLKKLGYHVLDDKFTLIYTHNKLNQIK